MQRHAHGLSARGRQMYGWPAKQDPCADQILEMIKLSLDEIRHLDAVPITLDQQILARRQPLQSIRQVGSKRFRIGAASTLSYNGLHDRKQVFTAVVDFRHQEFLLFFRMLSLGDVEIGYESAHRRGIRTLFQMPLALDPTFFSVVANDAIFDLADMT